MGNKPLSPYISKDELNDKMARKRYMAMLSLKHYYKDIKKRISYLESRGLHPPKYNLARPELFQFYPIESLQIEQRHMDELQRNLVHYEIDYLGATCVCHGDPTAFRYRIGEFWGFFEKNGGGKLKELAWWRGKTYMVNMEISDDTDPVKLVGYCQKV